MNKEIILHNLEILRQYLGVSTVELSTMFGKEQSYYRAMQNGKRIPSLDFVANICKYCHIEIDRFLYEKLELQLTFENDKDLHSGETESRGEDNE